MKLTVDISVFVKNAISWGRVWGSAEFAVVPAIGTTVSFAISGKEGVHLPVSFSSELKVEAVIFRPNVGDETGVMLFLEDLVVESTDQASVISEYLAQSFNFFVDKYVDEDGRQH